MKALKPLSIPSKIAQALSTFVEGVKKVYGDAEIYLFGSYAKGTWIEDSDVDVLVTSKHFEGLDIGDRAKALRKLAPRDVPFEILAYTPKEFKEALKRSVTLIDASEYWVKLTP